MPDMSTVKCDTLYCLFKGEAGLRKSTQALTFPKPIYFFSWDQKMEALKLPMKKWGINDKDIHFDDYNDWNAANRKLEQLRVSCPYKTIVIDTITSAGDAINRQTLGVKYGTVKKSGEESGKRIAGVPVNTVEDFNAETAVFAEIIAATKDIHKYHKVNIILIAHVIRIEEKNLQGITHVSRSIVTGVKKIAAKIPAYCGEIYHFNIKTDFDASKGGQYSLLTSHTGDDFARTSLELDREIVFGNERLYDNWIIPAINRLNSQNEFERK